ncbi:uncharacterized protein LOC113516413 [Galleria mellonella]|uniref:Uncharacterized protein LOC113516413 n=1 Tax=Galleria mellonella TaxID=7137 RepID=A0ABM3MPE9_GALME|nr:uncharacterized protein LOC113516413 [Galleria mellonella]
MKLLLISCLCFYTLSAAPKNLVKYEFCANLNCEDDGKENTCGIRTDGEGFQLRLFESVCELLKYGCQVDDEKAYGLINIDYCDHTFKYTDSKDYKLINKNVINEIEKKSDTADSCAKYDCTKLVVNSIYVCGIRQVDNGFKVRLFRNKCAMQKYNCEKKLQFVVTDSYICNGLNITNDTVSMVPTSGEEDKNSVKDNLKQDNLFIIDGSLFNYNNDINNTIDNFFAATHVFDLPVKEVPSNDLNANTRRLILNRFGPQKVFKPWITIPKNISEDHYHRPTLSSCYHKCPKKCPETYAPVCGVPGIVAREPSLMFQNHCFMDIAQCKMYWEDKSDTALSSSYIESSFLFCLGDEMNGLYRFLPLVRTLQHMGRLKKKAHFRYKLSNLRFFNNLLSREPKLMG